MKVTDVVFGGILAIFATIIFGVYVPKWISSTSDSLVALGCITLGAGILTVLAVVVHLAGKKGKTQK